MPSTPTKLCHVSSLFFSFCLQAMATATLTLVDGQGGAVTQKKGLTQQGETPSCMNLSNPLLKAISVRTRLGEVIFKKKEKNW